MHDDANYLELLEEELAVERAEDRIAEEEKQKQERLDYIKSVIDTMQTAASANELKKIHDVAVRKLGARRDESGVKRIVREWTEQNARFLEKAE